MKTLRNLLLLLVILPQVWGDEAADYIRQFQKTTDPAERTRLIEQAPPDTKEKLQKIDNIHKYALRYWRGEEKLRKARESYAIRARGLGDMEMVFHTHLNFWEGYISAVKQADRKAGMSIGEQQQVEAELDKQEKTIRDRVDITHAVVLNLAPSSAALGLENRAKQLAIQMAMRQINDFTTPEGRAHGLQPPITKQEWMDANKQVEQIYTELQALPKLPAEQVQKELDAVTDDKVAPNGGGWH